MESFLLEFSMVLAQLHLLLIQLLLERLEFFISPISVVFDHINREVNVLLNIIILYFKLYLRFLFLKLILKEGLTFFENIWERNLEFAEGLQSADILLQLPDFLFSLCYRRFF